MLNFSNTKNIFIHFLMAVIFTTLTACNDASNNNDAYIQVSIAGNSTQTRTAKNTPVINLAHTVNNVNVLPEGITRIDFKITDSEDTLTTTSLNVGPNTQTIKLRVAANRELFIVIEALTGNTVSFRGQTNVDALRPGQSFPLSVTLDEIGAPNNPVSLSLTSTSKSQLEGDDNSSNMTFEVSLSSLANGNVTVNYATSDLNAIAGEDYVAADALLTIPAGSLSATISIGILGDTLISTDRSFTLSLSNASANSILGTAAAVGTIIEDDFSGRLNDTGTTLCGDIGISASQAHNDLVCSASGSNQTNEGVNLDDDPVPAGQDAHYGRDASNNDDSDGLAGFSFTKLDAAGIPLEDQTQSYDIQPWACVKDNYTGLVWEVKTNGGLQSADETYTWYNSTGVNDGGDPGDPGFNVVGCTNSAGCNTQTYTSDINAANICNANNWRLPSIPELMSIINNSLSSPVIEPRYFPNNRLGYWTSNTPAQPSLSAYAWIVFTDSNVLSGVEKNIAAGFIRLVHSPEVARP